MAYKRLGEPDQDDSGSSTMTTTEIETLWQEIEAELLVPNPETEKAIQEGLKEGRVRDQLNARAYGRDLK